MTMETLLTATLSAQNMAHRTSFRRFFASPSAARQYARVKMGSDFVIKKYLLSGIVATSGG